MKIDLTKTKKQQQIKGFGTSSCWWSQYCAGDEAAEKISELLYGNSGLGLNIYRYNIGGGYEDGNCRIDNPWRKTESFYEFDSENEIGKYNFSADKTAYSFMKRCIKKGNIDTVILFANSPHWSQTSTGQSSGSLLYHTCNLPKMNYKKFADYMLDIAEHFLADGIPVKYISPINEPQWKWGGKSVWQEGCHYSPEEVAEVFHIFADEIIKRDLPIELYGPESGEMWGQTPEYLDALVSDKTIMKKLPVFAYHSYHDDDNPEARVKFKNEIVAKHPEFSFQMSEWCELPNKSHTKNFNAALITARIIGQDLCLAGSDSWTSWVAVNQICPDDNKNDFSDGFLSASDDFSKWYIAERYFGLAHFAKYIPVGSFCLDCKCSMPDNNKFNVFSFLTPENETVMVVVNEDEDREIKLNGSFKDMCIIESDKDKKLFKSYSGAYKDCFISKQNSIATVILK